MCPFRGSSDVIQHHFEETHNDDPPFVTYEARPRSSPLRSNTNYHSSAIDVARPEDLFAVCDRPGCGQDFLISEIDEHLHFHAALEVAEEEASHAPPLPPRRTTSPVSPTSQASFQFAPTRERVSTRDESRSRSIPDTAARPHSYSAGRPGRVVPPDRFFRPPREHRHLAIEQVGPYFRERQMPDDVRDVLIREGNPREVTFQSRDGRLRREMVYNNHTDGIIFVLSEICAMDKTTSRTYLCHNAVRHVYKIQCAGQFCGYWAIQTVLTCLQYMDPAGPQWIPNVLQIQNAIEAAWDRGLCEIARTELGGIRNTRKWIGSTESYAFFQYIGWNAIPFEFQSDSQPGGKTAITKLLDYVEAYFISGEDGAYKHRTSVETKLAPIYLQRPGHALVIVGMERKRDGSRNLLVFDSSYQVSVPVQQLAAGRSVHTSVERLLEVYRRSEERLSEVSNFEVIVNWPADDPQKR